VEGGLDTDRRGQPSRGVPAGEPPRAQGEDGPVSAGNPGSRRRSPCGGPGVWAGLRDVAILTFGTRSGREAVATRHMLRLEQEQRILVKIGLKLQSPHYQARVKADFKRRRLALAALSGALLVGAVAALPYLRAAGLDSPVSLLALGIAFFAGYVFLATRLHRCPACECQMDPPSRFGSFGLLCRRARCPRCDAPLR